MDITKPNEIDEGFQLIKDKFGKVDVLVDNAGFGWAGAIEETGISESRAIFDVNFFGTLRLTQTFYHYSGSKKVDTLFKFPLAVVSKHFQVLVFTLYLKYFGW